MFSSCQCVARRRTCSSEEAFFLFEQRDKIGIEDALVVSVAPHVASQVQTSLQETVLDLREEYPEHAEDIGRTRARTFTDLADFTSAIIKEKTAPIEDVSSQPASASDSAPASKVATRDGFADHEELTKAIYSAQGLDFSEVQGRAREFLRAMGLRPHDAGISNTDDTGRLLWNQCFYLSIARAYLGLSSAADQASGLALRLKRAIEAAVLSARPQWADGLARSADGDGQAMVFADFLPVSMREADTAEEPNFTAKLAVCILDSVSGHVEVYLGPAYKSLPDRIELERNLILLWYVPGHYQCIVKDDEAGSKVAMTYEEFKELLTKHGVVYIETLE